MVSTKLAFLALVGLVLVTYSSCSGKILGLVSAKNEEKLDPVNKTFFELSSNDVDGNQFNFSSLQSYKATLIFNSASL